LLIFNLLERMIFRPLLLVLLTWPMWRIDLPAADFGLRFN
jgi:hypothetical protein